MERRLNRRPGLRAIRAVGLLAALLAGGAAFAQDAALRDRVTQLVGRLDADKQDVREAAEKALIELGPRALPLLPDPASVKSAQQKDGLTRVREALVAAQEEASFSASIVTIKGEGIRLSEALKQLQQQSGNLITDLREQQGQEAANPALDLDIDRKPFFEALDLICKAADVTPNFYTGDGSIGLLGGAPDLPAQIGGGLTKLAAPVVYNGPFRIQFRQIVASKDVVSGAATANAQFEIAWEPRLRPMLLALRSEDVEITDDRGKTVLPSVSEESASVVLRPENPAAELNLNMDAPDRQAQRLATLKVKAMMTLPAGIRAFRFADLTKPGKQSQGDVSVALDAMSVEEHVWKLRVTLVYPGEGPAFESYRQGLFNNQLWLQRRDGGRLDHNGAHGGGFSNLGSEGGRLAFEYLFVDVPGKPAEYGLVYETPSRVETIPVEFEFKDVPLP